HDGGASDGEDAARSTPSRDDEPEMPERISEGRISDPAVAEQALVRRPKVGDTRPAPHLIPAVPPPGRAVPKTGESDSGEGSKSQRRRRRGGRGRSGERSQQAAG